MEILVVDDSRVQATVLRNLLEKNSYRVRVASNGKDALQLVQEKRPTLIISDIVMPIMNGYEMCRALKQDATQKSVPVILLTSLSDTEDILLGLNAQADCYLTKPYSAEYLLSTIQTVLESTLNPPDADGGENGMEVKLGINTHVVTANRRQMLSLLLSTYGNAVEQNRALLQAQHELKMLNDQLREQAERIEEQQRSLQQANERLQALATHDGLTGLKNHRAFKEKLNEEMQRATRYAMPLSLILLDADSFKSYNDSFGHPAGDEVLQTLARLMTEHSRSTDFVARYGGEEFAVLLPNTDQNWSSILAERLREVIERTMWPLRAVTASFGVATFSGSENADDLCALLVETADQALYHSKRNGRNRVTHANNLDAS